VFDSGYLIKGESPESRLRGWPKSPRHRADGVFVV